MITLQEVEKAWSYWAEVKTEEALNAALELAYERYQQEEERRTY